MLNRFLIQFEESVQRLKKRGINKSQLSIIKDNLEQINQLKKIINQQRETRNKLSIGPQNSFKVNQLKKIINQQEENLADLEKKTSNLIVQIPNFPAENVPLDENKFVDETKYHHSIKHQFTYEQIAKKLNIIDEKASIKLAGSKFVVYQGLGSQLVHALINFMLNEQQKKGYRLFTIPYLVKEHNLHHTGQLPKFQEDLFKLENSDFYLIPTAEVPLMNLYQNEILPENKLPLKLCAYSPCFRAEAGAAGQENKGLIRLHQFHKVELVRIVDPKTSYLHLKKLVEDARHILHLLEMPHRVIELSCKDLGFSSAKTYDLEIWLPNSKK